jgi:hypothetical protein
MRKMTNKEARTANSSYERMGDSVVTELAVYIQQNEPEIKGFSDKNIWRMKKFYETYKDFPKLSPMVREISWTHIFAHFFKVQDN